jgi:integrase
MRKAARAGLDPAAQRRTAREGVMTFQAAAEKVHVQRASSWRNAKHRDQWINTLRTYAFPAIGALPVGEVASSDVLRVLTPIWMAKPETARRVRQRVRAVLDWAVAAGHRSASLANAAIACRPGLPSQPGEVRHHPAVPWQEIPAFLAAVRASRSGEASRWALEFLLLTAARTSEVLYARWTEIDMAAKTWSVPAARMKRKREHRVPLSDQALHILREARGRWPNSPYVFPGRYLREPMSNATLERLMQRLPRDEVPHGLRSSFRDWCRDHRKDRDLAEAALSHAVRDKTEAAYARSDLLDARRTLMQEWADFCCAAEEPSASGEQWTAAAGLPTAAE